MNPQIERLKRIQESLDAVARGESLLSAPAIEQLRKEQLLIVQQLNCVPAGNGMLIIDEPVDAKQNRINALAECARVGLDVEAEP